ncbi:MAG: DUF5110 domain-containing protein [Fibrobacteres bacterium]|nr:DUF5110 domain-containing protein [Fibrobacterota bacterium]
MVQVGNARFTIYDSNAVRMEYSEHKHFENNPTLFAAVRKVDFRGYRLGSLGEWTIIETDRLKLYYRNDKKPFSAQNLKAEIISEKGSITTWHYGDVNNGNLGGTLQTLDALTGEVPLPPGILSREGWSFFDDSSTYTIINNHPEARLHPENSDVYLFCYGDDYKQALRSYFKVTGKVPLPRKSLLGSWYSRWWDYTEKEFLEIVQEYEDNGFPLDILVMDMGWHTQDAKEGTGWAKNLGWTGWTWNKELIPNPGRLLKVLKKKKIAVTLNVHPHGGIRSHEECYSEAAKIYFGKVPADKRAIHFNAGSKKFIKSYFDACHKPHEKMGVDFWWVDWQQDMIIPEVQGKPGLKHLPLLNHLYFNHTARDGRRGVSFSRFGGPGDHKYPIHFSGDAKSTWEMLKFEIYFNATAGNIGCFFWSHDLGGFYGERNPELYTRWVQFGLTTATMRIHSDRSPALDRRPWKWGEPFTGAMRKIFRLRSQLMPYIYSSVAQCHFEDLPLCRPMYLEYPSDERAYKFPHQFLFGDAILAAPIFTPGEGEDYVAEKEVWLPHGLWYDFFTGKKYSGNSVVKIRVPLDRFPLFIRGGVPVPMQEYTPRMGSSSNSRLELRCLPGLPNESHTFRYYEDDGDSDNYKKGKYRLIEFKAVTSKHGKVEISSTTLHDALPKGVHKDWN